MFTEKQLASPHHKELWQLLSTEERSWVILRCYSDSLLRKDEVEAYLHKDRLNNWFTNVLPIGIFPLIYKTLPEISPALKFGHAANRKLGFTLLAGLPLFIAWRRMNPFRTDLTAERERLLGVLAKRIGWTNLLNSNELLPRWMTEFEINRRLRVLVKQRTGGLSGVVFPTQDGWAPLLNFDPWRQVEGDKAKL